MSGGDHPALAAYLAELADALHLDRETALAALAEVRDHVHEAMAAARAIDGLDGDAAAARAVAAMGAAAELADGLNAVHAGHGTSEALMAAALPVVGSLALRGLVVSTQAGAAVSPYLIALAAGMLLVAPALRFARWRYAVASWTAFWAITLLLAGVG